MIRIKIERLYSLKIKIDYNSTKKNKKYQIFIDVEKKKWMLIKN